MKNKKFKVESQDSSGLSAFIKRPVPSEIELENFENVLDKEIKHQEIDANLNEIYSDKKGDLVDVSKMKKRGKNFLIVRIFKKLTFLVLLSLTAYFAYVHFFTGDANLEAVNFKINAPTEIKAGEEFTYSIVILNNTKFAISDISLDLTYPENYIFISSKLPSNEFNNSFKLDSLGAGSERIVEINGMVIDKEQSVSVAMAHLSYMPVNFSSQFKKESSTASVVNGFGFKVDINYPSLVFLGQSNEIVMSFSEDQNNFIKDFIVEFVPPKGRTISLGELETGNANDKLSLAGTNSFALNLEDLASKNITFKYLAKDETAGDSNLIINIKKRLETGESYIFAKYDINIEAVKSDLNIALFLNDSKNNQALSFGDTLNYSLRYSNKGDSSYKDAVITLVLNGKLYDFNSLKSSVEGDIRSNQIIWDKKKIQSLSEIKPGDEGEIEFTIKLKDYNKNLKSDDMEVSAYCQYGGDKDDVSTANKSNTITSILNTNLSLSEEIRYFDNNNLPVGSGPLPPRVGEETSYRVYFKIENSIHEIKDTRVSLVLPPYLNYLGINSLSVGSLDYNEESRELLWDLGKVPVSVLSSEASFTISLVPSVNDINKILVLSPGASASAFDTITKETVVSKSGAKTTKLEDDDIAALSNSGKIE